MLLADGWSEVDSLDMREKEEVIFLSLVRFISRYAHYGQATIRGFPQMQRKNVKSLLSNTVRYSVTLLIRLMTQLHNRIACN